MTAAAAAAKSLQSCPTLCDPIVSRRVQLNRGCMQAYTYAHTCEFMFPYTCTHRDTHTCICLDTYTHTHTHTHTHTKNIYLGLLRCSQD